MVCEDPFASENSVTVCTSRSAWLSHRSDSMHQVLYDGHDEHCLYVSFQPGLDVRYVMRGFGDIENADGRITSEDMEAVNTVAYPGNKLEFRKTSSAEISETQVLITVRERRRSPGRRLMTTPRPGRELWEWTVRGEHILPSASPFYVRGTGILRRRCSIVLENVQVHVVVDIFSDPP
jgi:hypothetical protein